MDNKYIRACIHSCPYIMYTVVMDKNGLVEEQRIEKKKIYGLCTIRSYLITHILETLPLMGFCYVVFEK